MNFKTISLICLSALSIISFNTLDKFIATDSITDDYYTSVKKEKWKKLFNGKNFVIPDKV